MKTAEPTKVSREAGWAWELPRADEPQMALSFYEHLQLRLPKGSATQAK